VRLVSWSLGVGVAAGHAEQRHREAMLRIDEAVLQLGLEAVVLLACYGSGNVFGGRSLLAIHSMLCLKPERSTKVTVGLPSSNPREGRTRWQLLQTGRSTCTSKSMPARPPPFARAARNNRVGGEGLDSVEVGAEL
jgi:hypothetical protein